MAIILMGCDIGNKGGISVIIDGEFKLQRAFNMTSLLETYNEIKKICTNLAVGGVATGKPNRMYNIILRHAQFIGVIAMVCEELNIPLVLVNDSTARAEILGKGNGKRKDLVHEKYKGETPDVSDSMLFAEWLYNNQKL